MDRRTWETWAFIMVGIILMDCFSMFPKPQPRPRIAATATSSSSPLSGQSIQSCSSSSFLFLDSLLDLYHATQTPDPRESKFVFSICSPLTGPSTAPDSTPVLSCRRVVAHSRSWMIVQALGRLGQRQQHSETRTGAMSPNPYSMIHPLRPHLNFAMGPHAGLPNLDPCFGIQVSICAAPPADHPSL